MRDKYAHVDKNLLASKRISSQRYISVMRTFISPLTPIDQLPHSLTVPEVARFAGRHVTTVYRAIKDRKLPPPHKVNERTLTLKREDVLTWLGLLDAQGPARRVPSDEQKS
jgi:predicted DNA-binding transcriptional regulator AlpA